MRHHTPTLGLRARPTPDWIAGIRARFPVERALDAVLTRKLVDRAKGLLNDKMGLSEPEAFRWIQKASMDRRLTMHDVSQAILAQLAAKK
jgi:AmiR/NasT family two-component response regulator